jgi:hypothetical protein
MDDIKKDPADEYDGQKHIGPIDRAVGLRRHVGRRDDIEQQGCKRNENVEIHIHPIAFCFRIRIASCNPRIFRVCELS